MITDLLNKISLFVSDLIPDPADRVHLIAFLVLVLFTLYSLELYSDHPSLFLSYEPDDSEEDEKE